MILFQKKPRDVRVKMSDGRVIPCEVARDRSADRNGIRAWLAIPAEPVYEGYMPFDVLVGKLPPRTQIYVEIAENPPGSSPGGSVTYLP